MIYGCDAVNLQARWVLLELHEALKKGMQTQYCGTADEATLDKGSMSSEMASMKQNELRIPWLQTCALACHTQPLRTE